MYVTCVHCCVRVHMDIASSCIFVLCTLCTLHALGNPRPKMDGMTDDLVDITRKKFAMDLYKDWVIPLYVGDETK